MNFEALFSSPSGRSPRSHFIPALLTVLAVIAFFVTVVSGRTAEFCVLVLLYPAFVLLARRLRDMGQAVWLLLPPLALMLSSQFIQLGYIDLGEAFNAALLWTALTVCAAYAVWGCLSSTRQ